MQARMGNSIYCEVEMLFHFYYVLQSFTAPARLGKESLHMHDCVMLARFQNQVVCTCMDTIVVSL